MILTILMMITVVGLMLAINALYVAGEFATVSARKSRIYQEAEQGSRLASLLLPVMNDRHKLDNYIAASQVGITLSSLILGIFGERQIAPFIEPALEHIPGIGQTAASGGISAILVLVFLTTMQVVLGELVPKTIAIQYPERLALLTTLPMRWSAEIILRPLIVVLNGSGTLILRLLGIHGSGGHKHVHSPEEIRILIEESQEGGLLDERDRQLLDNAFRVSEMTAGQIAVPRTRMTAAPVDRPLAELLPFAANSPYTRIPIYEGDLDHIIGFVHLKDLFRLYHENTGEDIRSILRDIPFVPESMSTADIWTTLDQHQSYLVIVFDEYGGTTGMITREDLIEEVFGELQDEFDQEQELIAPTDHENQYRVRGDMLISRLNDRFELELSNTYAHTINGLIQQHLGRIAEIDDTVTIDGIELTVEDIDGLVPRTIRITMPTTSTGPAPTEKEAKEQ